MATMFPYRRASNRGLRALSGYLDEFNESLDQANHDWEILVERARSDVNAEIGPSVALLTKAVEFYNAMSKGSQQEIVDSVAAMISQLGPVGAWAAQALEWIQKFANWVTSAAPAYALQVQDQHIGYLDWWVGKHLLGFTNENVTTAITAQRVAGWAETIFSVNHSRDWCLRSDPWLGSMAPTPTTLDGALDRFRWIAGPRAAGIPRCTEWASDYFAWYDTPEGRASVPVANRIATALSGNDFTETTLQSGACKAWVSKGLVLVFNIEHDINPGYAHNYVYLSGIKVNVSFLPDEMLSMLGTYYSLYYQKSRILGSELGPADRDRIQRAAFGPDLQGLKKYNLLRLIIMGDPSIGLGVLAEVGRRSEVGWGRSSKTAARRDTMTSRSVAQAGSSIGPVAVVGGLGLAGLAAWLLLK